MPTITVKNIPDGLYQQLKAAAQRNRRSLNGEIISRIEQSLRSRRATTDELLSRVRRLQESYGPGTLRIEDLDAAKREGRA